jgi:hypothetical protein
MASSTLRKQLVQNLKDDLKFNLLGNIPISATQYVLAHGRGTEFQNLAICVGTSVLEQTTYSLIHNLSEFSLLSFLPSNPTFKRRIVLAAGTRFTASVLTAAVFKKPFSAQTYLVYPMLSQVATVFRLILEKEAEGDAFVGEYAPALLSWVKNIRNLTKDLR